VKLHDRYRLADRLITGASVALGATGFFVMRGAPDVGVILAASAGLFYFSCRRHVWGQMVGSHYQRLREATEREEWVEARRLVDELKVPNHPTLALSESWILCEEERWQEAYDLLASVDRRRIPKVMLAPLLNNMSWALAHLGRHDEAIEVGEAALAVADATSRPYCLGTLGTAKQMAGKPGEAVPLLQEALATRGARPAAQVVRGFYLGEALMALGRTDEARVAYLGAVQAAPGTQYGRRAQGRLGGDYRADLISSPSTT
jgi:tetratricopeptide (TPR) repeat protein